MASIQDALNLRTVPRQGAGAPMSPSQEDAYEAGFMSAVCALEAGSYKARTCMEMARKFLNTRADASPITDPNWGPFRKGWADAG